MLDSASISTLVLLAAASALLLAAMLYPSSLLRWLQRKRYQYEVTFSLYMLTSTEKFILSMFSPRHTTAFRGFRTQGRAPAASRFEENMANHCADSVLFLLLSLFIIAASLYLPEHIAFMANRMFYYFSGDSSHFASAAPAKSPFTTAAAQFLSNTDAVRQAGGSGLPHEL